MAYEWFSVKTDQNGKKNQVTLELAIFDLKFVISILKLLCSQNFRFLFFSFLSSIPTWGVKGEHQPKSEKKIFFFQFQSKVVHFIYFWKALD